MESSAMTRFTLAYIAVVVTVTLGVQILYWVLK
jgi:hypothetical protein